MRVLILYDSVFGNTEQIARGMGAALDAEDQVEVLRVSERKGALPQGVNLLIVGSPTRAFRPTPAIVEHQKALPAGSLRGLKAAAFDTRMALEDIRPAFLRFLVRLGGYAAKPIAARLRQAGGTLVLPPEGFCVLGSEGPLKEGELERAAQWARAARQAAATTDAGR